MGNTLANLGITAASCLPPPTFDNMLGQEEDIRKRTSAAGINADTASAGLGSGNALGGGGGGDEATQELAAAVESLPKLLEQKKGLEMHTNILKVLAVTSSVTKLIERRNFFSYCTRSHFDFKLAVSTVSESIQNPFFSCVGCFTEYTVGRSKVSRRPT